MYLCLNQEGKLVEICPLYKTDGIILRQIQGFKKNCFYLLDERKQSLRYTGQKWVRGNMKPR